MHLTLAALTLTDWFGANFPGWSPWVAATLAAIIHTTLVGAFFGLPAFAFIWAERKVAGRIQDRLGPTRVGGRFGWLQSLADGIKLIQKEDLAPDAADKMLFQVSPYIVVAAAFAAFMFIPFSDGWVSVAMDVGLFVALAVLSLEVLGIVLAGYSSGSKWSLFGGMREAAQMVSYEVPLGITAVIPVLIAGSMNLNEIVALQQGWVFNWLIFHDVFTFFAFFVFFTVTLASNKRAPFDLAEAESELVGGFHTEYSGMRWSFFFLAEYAAMYFVSMLAALLFLGGWWTGIPALDSLFQAISYGLAAVAVVPLGWLASLVSWVAGVHLSISHEALAGYMFRIVGMLIVLTKAGLLVFVQIWIRWTLPRLRIDQVMATCLKYLVPISCFLFLGAVTWPLVLISTLHRTTLLPTMPIFNESPIGDRMPASNQPARVVPPASESGQRASLQQGGSLDSQSNVVSLTSAQEGI